ncbi:hypothetical protein DRJ73_15230, partial [Enterococcus faecalis]
MGEIQSNEHYDHETLNSEAFRSSITEDKDAKQFLKDVEKFFTKNEKVEASSLLSKLVSMRYKGKWNIRE